MPTDPTVEEKLHSMLVHLDPKVHVWVEPMMREFGAFVAKAQRDACTEYWITTGRVGRTPLIIGDEE